MIDRMIRSPMARTTTGLSSFPHSDHELVPAEAGYRVTAPGEGPSPAADLRRAPGRGIVTAGIVDLLEVVQIDEEHRQPCRVDRSCRATAGIGGGSSFYQR